MVHQKGVLLLHICISKVGRAHSKLIQLFTEVTDYENLGIWKSRKFWQLSKEQVLTEPGESRNSVRGCTQKGSTGTHQLVGPRSTSPFRAWVHRQLHQVWFSERHPCLVWSSVVAALKFLIILPLNSPFVSKVDGRNKHSLNTEDLSTSDVHSDSGPQMQWTEGIMYTSSSPGHLACTVSIGWFQFAVGALNRWPAPWPASGLMGTWRQQKPTVWWHWAWTLERRGSPYGNSNSQ